MCPISHLPKTTDIGILSFSIFFPLFWFSANLFCFVLGVEFETDCPGTHYVAKIDLELLVLLLLTPEDWGYSHAPNFSIFSVQNLDVRYQATGV